MTALQADIPEAPGALLAPEPAVRTGALIGYAGAVPEQQPGDHGQQLAAGTSSGMVARESQAHGGTRDDRS